MNDAPPETILAPRVARLRPGSGARRCIVWRRGQCLASRSRAASGGFGAFALGAAVLGAAVAALYGSALRFALIGDDYQWVRHAHHALRDPGLLVAWFGGYFRPSTTWTFVTDRLLWGTSAAGARATCLCIHYLNALLLFAAGARLGVHRAIALGVALLWALSPHASQIALEPAMRADALLALGWLAVICAWPKAGQAWRPLPLGIAACGLLLAALSKETWVATPLLVLLLELGQRRSSFGRALQPTALAVAAVLAYLLCYGAAANREQFGTYRIEARHAGKLLHVPSAFLMLEDYAADYPAGWRGVVGALALAAAGLHAFRRRVPASVVGVGLLVGPLVPVLFIPYLPTRYVAIPYAGFLLLVAGLFEREALLRSRRLVAPLLGFFAVVIGASGILGSRDEVAHLGRLASLHEPLIAEARSLVDSYPLRGPVLYVRGENRNLLDELVAIEQDRRWIYFVRGVDPYGLIDVASLLEYVREDGRLYLATCREGTPARTTLLLHVDGGFQIGQASTDEVAALLQAPDGGEFPSRLLCDATSRR